MDVLELLGGVLKALWGVLSFVAELDLFASPDLLLMIPALLWAGGAFALALMAGASAVVASALAFAAFVAALVVYYFSERDEKSYGYTLWVGALVGTGVIAVAILRAAVATQPAH